MLWVEQPVGTGFSQGEPNINVRNSVLAKIQRTNVVMLRTRPNSPHNLSDSCSNSLMSLLSSRRRSFILQEKACVLCASIFNLSLIFLFSMLGCICPVGVFVRRAESAHMIGLSDIADYMFSHPTLLNLKVQGMWLASRMFVQHICLLLHWDDDDSQLFLPRMPFRRKCLLWTLYTRI